MAPLCLSCGATSTPMWRSGPEGPRTLCNACGLRRRNHPSATREGCASSGATVQQSGKRGRESSTSSSSSLCRLSKVRGSSLASRAAAADAATSREEQSAAPPSVGVELLSAIALSRGRRYFSAGRGARASPLPQSSPTGALVRPGASIGGNGTGSSRARSTASSAFRGLVDGSRNLPKALPSASLGHEGVGGDCLVSGGTLPHTSLPSSVAKDGMHAVPAASGSTASRGLSWTAADAVVPAKVKQEPEPAAVIKQEELAVDKGRRRAVAIALRHTLYPPDGVDKAAILRAAYRTTTFARRTNPRAGSGEPSACRAVVAVAAAEPGADSNTAVVSGSRTLRTGDAEIAAAAARLVAAKVSGKAPADRQADAVIHGAGGGFDGADEARAATVGAAGAVADEATGRRLGERDGGHGSPRRSGDAHKDPSGDAQKDKSGAAVQATAGGQGAHVGAPLSAVAGGGGAAGSAEGAGMNDGEKGTGSRDGRACGVVSARAEAQEAGGSALEREDGADGGAHATRSALDAVAAVTMEDAGAASTAANVDACMAAATGGRSGIARGGCGLDARAANVGDGGAGAGAAATGREGAAERDGAGECTPAQPVAGVLHLQEERAAAAAAVAGGRDAVAVPGFRFCWRGSASGAAPSSCARRGACRGPERPHRCGRIPFGIRWR
ncbi:hypothetical protein BU14_0390s0003, partial [Porphyra umbilicalis]